MKKVIDARGLSCPQPVVLTKKGLEESGHITTIVDNSAAVENVTKLAKNKGIQVRGFPCFVNPHLQVGVIKIGEIIFIYQTF
jgi:TusA-related sulfurtransferase